MDWIEAIMCKNIRDGEEMMPVDKTDVFTIQDKQAIILIKIKDLKAKHTIRWKWYDPKGIPYYETKEFPVGLDDTRYKVTSLLHRIGIFGEKAADLLGAWKVQVALDGKDLITKDFKIVGSIDPDITFVSPTTSVVYDEDLTLNARVEDEIGLKDVQIKINGESSKVIGFREGEKMVNIGREIILQEGENSIEIIAYNGCRQVTKEKKVTYTKRANIFSGLSPYHTSWALIVGINDYKHIPKLNYPVADAQAIKDILVQDMGFSKDNITNLTNQEATRANILRYLGDVFPKVTGAEDRVLVFFAGHGYTRKRPHGGDMGYLMPVEATANNVHSTAISMAEIGDISSLIPAKHVLFIVDACYSGLIGMTLRDLKINEESGVKDTSEYLAQLTSSTGRQILTAGKADEQVVESDQWGHSVYTKCLIQGLKEREADLNKDGLITVSELQSYLQPRVSKESGYKQTPQIRYLQGEGEFVFLPQ